MVTGNSLSRHLKVLVRDNTFQAGTQMSLTFDTGHFHVKVVRQLCPTALSAQPWSHQRARIPPCKWMDASTLFEEWLKETGLARPVDFKFAFCSAQEAADHAQAQQKLPQRPGYRLLIPKQGSQVPGPCLVEAVQARRQESPSYEGGNHTGCTILDRSPLAES